MSKAIKIEISRWIQIKWSRNNRTYEELNLGQGGNITDVHNLLDFIVSELIKIFSVCLIVLLFIYIPSL